MFIRSQPIEPVRLTAAAAIIYTAPTNFRGTVKQLTATNTTATARTITVYRVPSGGSPSTTNTVISAETIPPSGNGNKSLADRFANQVLNPGDTLQALCSAADAVSMTGGVIEEAV